VRGRQEGGRQEEGRQGVVRDIVRDASLQRLCIANTHLLFNPRRGDVKLAQMMLLLSEIDRLSHLDDFSYPLRSVYHPTLICGDFNSEPYSQLYEFMRHGRINFAETIIRLMGVKREEGYKDEGGYSKSQQPLSNDFLNVKAGITDRCQYLEACKARVERLGNVSADVMSALLAQGTGSVLHQHNLVSVFDHIKTRHAADRGPDGVRNLTESESTTCHKSANCTVDYIFFSPSLAPPSESAGGTARTEVSQDQLRLLARLTLPTASDMESTGGLPNEVLSSDHIPLLAKFALRLN